MVSTLPLLEVKGPEDSQTVISIVLLHIPPHLFCAGMFATAFRCLLALHCVSLLCFACFSFLCLALPCFACFSFLCLALPCFACFSFLCLALLCVACWLCFAWPCFAWLCFALLCFALLVRLLLCLLCFACMLDSLLADVPLCLFCFACLLCFSLACPALLCFVVLCFDLLLSSAWLVCLFAELAGWLAGSLACLVCRMRYLKPRGSMCPKMRRAVTCVKCQNASTQILARKRAEGAQPCNSKYASGEM